MAISRARVATAVYIVRIAPKIAPMPIEAGDPEANRLNQAGQRLRLTGVVLVLAADRHVQLRIRRQPVAEGVERLGRLETGEHGLIGVAAPVGALQRPRVAPDLGFRHAAVGLEDADHLPAVLTRDDGVADVQADELSARAAPDDDFVGAELEHPSLDDATSPGAAACAAGSMPRIGTFADESGVDFFGRSMMT